MLIIFCAQCYISKKYANLSIRQISASEYQFVFICEQFGFVSEQILEKHVCVVLFFEIDLKLMPII